MKLVVIADTGEQIDVRCDGCKHWSDMHPADPPDEAEPGGWCDGGGLGRPVGPRFGCAMFERKETA